MLFISKELKKRIMNLEEKTASTNSSLFTATRTTNALFPGNLREDYEFRRKILQAPIPLSPQPLELLMLLFSGN